MKKLIIASLDGEPAQPTGLIDNLTRRGMFNFFHTTLVAWLPNDHLLFTAHFHTRNSATAAVKITHDVT